MRLNDTSAYQEMMINSKMLEVPRGTYPGCSTRPRSVTAMAVTMYLTASTPSRPSSC